MATDPQSQLLRSPIMQALAARQTQQSAQVPGRAAILQRMLAQARQRPAMQQGGAGGGPAPGTPMPYRPGLPGQDVAAAAPPTPPIPPVPPVVPGTPVPAQRPPVMAAPVARRYPVNLGQLT